MVGGRLRCLSCFLTCSSVILFGVCLRDVEASSCQRVIHKKVGDTVELPSCSQTEGITVAVWKYGESRIADKDINIDEPHFKGRLTLNRTTFSLTVRALTVQDSGDFSFFGEKDEKQLDTVTITLKVHEPITKQPVLTSNSTWHASSGSCTVFLECSAAADGSVAYNWTVRNRTISGSRLQYTIREQDVDTKFTCTVSNFVSELSTSTSVKCSNVTQHEKRLEHNIFFLAAIGGGCLMVVILLVIAVATCYCKQSPKDGSDTNDLTVYADISEVTAEGTSSTLKPCSVYETIDNITSVTPGPQTVYDKIQLNRVRKVSASPYQDVS